MESKVTPMMAQWHSCKAKAKEAVLFFRMGDFYESFYEDAHLAAKELELTLTQRQGIPMSGVPHMAVDTYIDRLVAKGYRVAIAEQMEDPKTTKGLVKREVVRIVSPGSLVESSLLQEKVHNYFAAVTQVGDFFGLALLELTTGDFFTLELPDVKSLASELYRAHPSEVLTSEKFLEKHPTLFEELRYSYSFLLNTQPEWTFDHQSSYATLTSHFSVHNLDGFGLKGMIASINAAGALLAYIRDHLCLSVRHLQHLYTTHPSAFLQLDRITVRNLELCESLHSKGHQNTLLDVLDRTKTPMGARLMRQWILQPLQSTQEIVRRQDAITEFLHHSPRLPEAGKLLGHIRDLERLTMKVSTGLASPRDLIALRFSLEQVPLVKTLFKEISSSLIQEKFASLVELPELVTLLHRALVDEPPCRIGEGQVFKEGYHEELDALRSLSRDGKAWIARYQVQLREETGIKTLKVGFTHAFGYYIEVSKGQAAKMPETFMRRQTLVNTERFISPVLKEYEQKVFTAEDRLLRLENELFHALRSRVAEHAEEIQRMARAISHLDCLLSLAVVALQWNYSRPIVDDSAVLEIKEGRHPIIEACLLAQSFTPNDTSLNDNEQRLLLLTGPNMAGKSTYIRQVALIALMAHMGSFVPAKKAHIGLLDKIFTRIGASDDLSRGQSTFMVEMTETANILHHATSRSLVILDEIGRGTSTYDGISIAWAVAEFLLKTEGKRAKTLFATHYWELTKLEEEIPGAVNYTVAVSEGAGGIVFLHRIVRGGTDKSYGIHVARLAGLPSPVICRAKEILDHLEEKGGRKNLLPSRRKSPSLEYQPTFFE